MSHQHRESGNPRKAGWCDCGWRLAPDEAPSRDREFEREATRQLAVGLGLDIRSLNVLAEHRANAAQAEYGHDFPELARNLEREALEELADARNYIVWRLDAIHRGLQDDNDRVSHLQRALRHVALAFEEVRAAEGGQA